MRMIPHMRMLAPSNEAELVHALHTALELGGPFAIRYPRGAAEGVALPDEPHVLEEGRARVIREGDDVAILAFGRDVYKRQVEMIVAALQESRYDTGLDLDLLFEIAEYWEDVYKRQASRLAPYGILRVPASRSLPALASRAREFDSPLDCRMLRSLRMTST